MLFYSCENPPILIMCKNRIRYVDVTLKSISATVPKNVNIYLLADGPDNPAMVQYITTSNYIVLDDFEFPNDKELWIKYCGLIPNKKIIIGIADKINVIHFQNNRYMGNFNISVKKMLQNGANWVIRVEGDVVFKPNWYKKLSNLLVLAKQNNVGIFSGCRHIFPDGKLPPNLVPVRDDVEELVTGKTGSQLYAISKVLCDKNPHLIRDSDLKKGADDFWIDGCRQAKMKIWVSQPGSTLR